MSGKASRRYSKAVGMIESGMEYSVDEAINKLLAMPSASFDETVEVASRLGVDPRHADQVVRGTVVLPHGLGKQITVTVIAREPKTTEAKEAGADIVGGEEIIEKISGGWFDFDVCITTPDMMGQVGKLGKLLGPRGLMPNPKSGTVTMDIGKAVNEAKAGKIEFRVDKAGIVHAPLGKKSFSSEVLMDNFKAFYHALIQARPAASKGQYVRSLTVSTTMSPGVKIDRSSAQALIT